MRIFRIVSSRLIWNFASIWLVFCTYCGSGKKFKNERCVYDLKLEENYIKVTCRGKHPGISIEGDTNLINEAENGNEAVVSRKERDKTVSDSVTNHEQNTDKTSHISRLYDSYISGMSNMTNSILELKPRLLKHLRGISDIGSLLSRGDEQLRGDLEKLRGVGNFNEQNVREAILAAVQNQYNFLRTGLETQNSEMTSLLHTMDALVERTGTSLDRLTNVGIRLSAEIESVHDMMGKLQHRMVKTKKGNRHKRFLRRYADSCPKVLSSIGDIGTSVDVGMTSGTIMRDAWNKAKKVWIMYGHVDSKQLLEYGSDTAFKYDIVSKTHILPFKCEGTGHVILDNAIYCLKSKTRQIVKYDFVKEKVLVERDLPFTVGVHDTFPYDFGKFSDIDFAVDERGVWMIYATDESVGKMVLTKLNVDNLKFEETWITNYPKPRVGNAFMACGIMYATDSSSNSPTYIKYTFDTADGTDKFLEAGDLFFANSMGSSESSSVTLSYNPEDEKLYSWNGGQVEIYTLFFKRKSRGG